MEKYDARVDAYIAKSADFAKPILTHLRELVRKAAPELQEAIKWGSPFFDYKGPVCHMMAFKQHCGFGFWKAALLPDSQGFIANAEKDVAGSFGRITSLADLPPDEVIIQYIHDAIALNESEVKTTVRKNNTEKKELVTPDYFTARLAIEPQAKAYFEKFSPSQKKEYVEWIVDAKTDATRQKRLDTAIEWISEGKTRHWKYK
ncbi:MAG: hypothetical protein EOP46_17045 [Sphingobacteriaceae bacterium]|nr:MAG: hypothetical protein EOP46_17045 [Sphingobacteriaceae bacterium]